MTSSSTASVKPAPVFRRFSFSLRDAGTLIGLIIIMAVFAALVPGFVSERNLINILQQSSINACLALGMSPANARLSMSNLRRSAATRLAT